MESFSFPTGISVKVNATELELSLLILLTMLITIMLPAHPFAAKMFCRLCQQTDIYIKNRHFTLYETNAICQERYFGELLLSIRSENMNIDFRQTLLFMQIPFIIHFWL